jgi:hypothetical protein
VETSFKAALGPGAAWDELIEAKKASAPTASESARRFMFFSNQVREKWSAVALVRGLSADDAQIFNGSGDANGCCTEGAVLTSTEGSPAGFTIGAGTSGGSTAGADVVPEMLSESVIGESIIDVVLGVCMCSF